MEIDDNTTTTATNRKTTKMSKENRDELEIKIESVEFELNEDTLNENSMKADDVIDITTASNNFEYSENDDSQLSAPDVMTANSNKSQSHFEIVSVCSLNTNENSSSLDSDLSSSIVTDQRKTEFTYSEYSNKKAFGIAKSNSTTNTKDAPLLVALKSKRHRRTKLEMDFFREKSKLVKMKEKLNNFHQIRSSVTPTTSTSNKPLSTTTSSTSATAEIRSTSRRKNVHRPINDGAIEFMAENKSSDQMQTERLKIVRGIKNPNLDLMKKVAFLRVCVNYMLEEIGQKPQLFYHQISLERMKSQYRRFYMK